MRKLVIDFDLIVLWPSIAFSLIMFATSFHISRRNRDLYVRDSLWVSAAALLGLSGIMLMSDIWKLCLAYLAWEALQFASTITLIIAAGAAWNYAYRQERLKLLACLLAMLMAAASTEHCFHQKVNTGHAVCPHCNDESDSSDN